MEHFLIMIGVYVFSMVVTRENNTYRVVSTSRLKAPRHLVVHDNLKAFTKYSERSVHHLIGLASVKCYIIYVCCKTCRQCSYSSVCVVQSVHRTVPLQWGLCGAICI